MKTSADSGPDNPGVKIFKNFEKTGIVSEPRGVRGDF